MDEGQSSELSTQDICALLERYVGFNGVEAPVMESDSPVPFYQVVMPSHARGCRIAYALHEAFLKHGVVDPESLAAVQYYGGNRAEQGGAIAIPVAYTQHPNFEDALQDSEFLKGTFLIALAQYHWDPKFNQMFVVSGKPYTPMDDGLPEVYPSFLMDVVPSN